MSIQRNLAAMVMKFYGAATTNVQRAILPASLFGGCKNLLLV